MNCKDCEYCEKLGGRMFGRTITRAEYFCEHPETRNLKDDIGRPIYNFIGYGERTGESQLQLKSSKKWCPLKKGEKNERLGRKF